MKTGVLTRLFLAALCLVLLGSGALGETRESVIWLEGQEEPIEETLYESGLGFSFWYASDRLEAWNGEKDLMEGVIVEGLYLDDFVILSMIPEEDAVEYVDDLDLDIVAQSAESRVQQDIYWELEDGRYYFLTVIAEGGRYLRAVGEYSQESAEGNGKFLQRILDSVTFTADCLLRADWGADEPDDEDDDWDYDEEDYDEEDYDEEDDEGDDVWEYDGEETAGVILTALAPVTDVKLLHLDWDDEMAISWEEGASLGNLDTQQSVGVALTFIGDMPNNGVLYTDGEGVTHAFALDISGEDGRLILWEIVE